MRSETRSPSHALNLCGIQYAREALPGWDWLGLAGARRAERNQGVSMEMSDRTRRIIIAVAVGVVVIALVCAVLFTIFGLWPIVVDITLVITALASLALLSFLIYATLSLTRTVLRIRDELMPTLESLKSTSATVRETAKTAARSVSIPLCARPAPCWAPLAWPASSSGAARLAAAPSAASAAARNWSSSWSARSGKPSPRALPSRLARRSSIR